MAGTTWTPLGDAARFACLTYRQMHDAVSTRQVIHRKRRNGRIEVTVASLVAFCDRLVANGKLQRDDRNGKATYSPAK